MLTFRGWWLSFAFASRTSWLFRSSPIGQLNFLGYATIFHMGTWNPKQSFINGCFNWMIPNLYIENGCFTKHPVINGCLGFQVVNRVFTLSPFHMHIPRPRVLQVSEKTWGWKYQGEVPTALTLKIQPKNVLNVLENRLRMARFESTTPPNPPGQI